MTNATRWGVSALMMIGGLSLGAFAGCSDDDEKTSPQPETDTGVVDTAVPDTGTPPADTTPDTPPDTPPFVPDRAATLLFAAPDLGEKFVCFGAFVDDPATKDAPLQTLPATGAVGIPDPAAPTDYTKTSPFPYGAVVPIPLSSEAVAALTAFNFVVYLVDANPAASGKTCGTIWKDIKGDTWRWKSFPKGTVAAGEHGLVVMQGCRGAATANGACGGTGNNFEIKLRKAAMTKPTEAGANVGFQFLHLSQFPGAGVAPPGFQNVDIYLKPGPSSTTGDAGTDDGGDADGGTAPELIKIAENVKYDDEITALKGYTLPAGVKNADSFLVIAPRIGGTAGAACSNAGPAPTSTCPNWTLPLAPFFSATTGYQNVGGGLEFANTNQVIGLIGSPIEPLADAGMGVPTLRIPFARGGAWTP